MANIYYQNWFVELGLRPGQTLPDPGTVGRPLSTEDVASVEPDGRAVRTRRAVRAAIEQLDPDERLFIEQFYFLGRSYRDLAEDTRRAKHKLAALHNRAIRRLRHGLAPFVAAEFGLSIKPRRVCRICESRDREKIERVIRGRNRRETWRPVLRELRNRLALTIVSPQTLITHEKYHMIHAEKGEQGNV